MQVTNQGTVCANKCVSLLDGDLQSYVSVCINKCVSLIDGDIQLCLHFVVHKGRAPGQG